jgi:hypothetical protein
MRVRLTRKLAEMIDGVDLTRSHAGDLLEVAASEARLLISEGWAVPERRAVERLTQGIESERAANPPASANDQRPGVSNDRRRRKRREPAVP